MKILGICILIFSGIFVLISVIYFIAYFVFEKLPDKTSKAFGKLYNRKYKKDVNFSTKNIYMRIKMCYDSGW